ncbi:MAG: transglutaminase-like cysteine peptidase [Alphaproteobacteria bacterium]|nr:transglutaminase-like cysteine peptidase [Alphaproteobacteria bacterium]MBU0863126.1 transglutaminase-like cysteine peptidase [Alphaproteobacteria bacterium]MBU1825191.1 transglutaminase-like cysteine peptidase [Alphaproteobacteria bacterium]
MAASKNILGSGGAVRLAMVIAATTLSPATAYAAIETPTEKLVNAKLFAIGDTCRSNAALSLTAPSFATSPLAVGKTPSALDRMRMRQEGIAPMAASVPTQAASLIGRAIAGGAEGLFSHPRARMADLRQPVTQSRVNCGQQVVAAPTPTVDEDSELGTQAIPVDSTRFDDRWARIRRAPAMQLMQAQLQHAAVTNVLNERDTLDRVNRWVNRRIVYIADENNDRQRDYWATADETVARGSGDCEDFAILKMHMLRAAGIDEDRMKLVLLRDLAINADHALLLVRSNAGWVVLDNMTDRIYDGRQSDTMRPILSFSGNRRWVHGYRDIPASTARATFATGKAATGFASAAPAATWRTSFKTALVSAMGVKLALAHVSIGNELPKMFGRLRPRGVK